VYHPNTEILCIGGPIDGEYRSYTSCPILHVAVPRELPNAFWSQLTAPDKESTVIKERYALRHIKRYGYLWVHSSIPSEKNLMFYLLDKYEGYHNK